MAQQNINLGTAPAGVDGDTNRTAWGKTQANFTELYGRPIAVGKNRLINGNFDIWQRGTTSGAPAVGAAYLADRWGRSSFISQMVASRQAFAHGQADVPGNPTYFHRVQVVSVANAGAAANMSQSIEDVRTFAGQTCTMTFWARADAAKSIYFEMYQVFGSGGSAVVVLPGLKVNLTTAWQKFTLTFDVPSIVGKTIGPGSSLNAGFWFDAGSNFNARTNNLGQQSGLFDIAQVQVEAGPTATAFEERPIGFELSLCQRYYEKSYSQGVNPGTPSSPHGRTSVFLAPGATGLSGQIAAPFKVIKRALGAAVVYNDNTGVANTIGQDDGSSITPSVVIVGDSGLYVSWTNTAGRYGGSFHYVIDAEF